jgi:hypothetical protein
VAVLAALVMVATACGDDGSGSDTTSPTTSEVGGPTDGPTPSGELVTVTTDDGAMTARVPAEWEAQTGPDGFIVAPSTLAFSAGYAAPGVAATLLVGQDDPQAALDAWLSDIGGTGCEELGRRTFESGAYDGWQADLACDGVEFSVVTAARGTGSSFIAQIQATTDAEADAVLEVVTTIDET